MQDFNWKRYWSRSGSVPRIDDNGFLYVWKEFENSCFELEHFSNEPALILLGDPGMGKSTELSSFVKNTANRGTPNHYVNLNTVPDTSQLLRKVFQSEKIENWKAGTGTLHLFLDSLDEALININVLSGFIADELLNLPTDRLSLRVACRSAEWASFSKLESVINEKWKTENSKQLQLAPLRSDDVKEAAKVILGTDSHKFLDGVYARGLGPLAAKPITLQLLLNIFAQNSEFPATKSELYYKGCLALCDEDYADRPASREKDELSPIECLRIAAILAASFIFSGKSGLWNGREADGPHASDIRANEVIPLGVDGKALRETTQKGLFGGESSNRIRFSHQTFAEFLAAWYLDDQHVSNEALINLIGEQHIHPQLYETASWMAMNRPAVFEHLLDLAPMVLLRSDVLSLNDENRRRLVDRLLSGYEKKESYAASEFQHFRKLVHSGLDKQLRAFINDKAKEPTARIAAINIARSTKSVGLEMDLRDRALDVEEDSYIRLTSVFTHTEIGSKETIADLSKLLSEDDSTDPKGDLRFQAVENLWPQHLTVDQLFETLDNINREIPYALVRKLSETLTLTQLPAAFRWFRKKTPNGGSLSYYDEMLIGKLVLLAWDNLEHNEIVASFAELAIAFAHGYKDIFSSTLKQEKLTTFVDDVEKRKKILLKMLSYVESEDDLWHAFYNSPILSFHSFDAPWMIDEFSKFPKSDVGLFLLSILKGWIVQSQGFYSEGMDPGLLNQILKARDMSPEFEIETLELLRTVEFNSSEHLAGLSRYRTFLAQKNKWNSVKETEQLLNPSPTELLIGAIDDFEQGNIDAWWQKINYFMMFSPTGRSMVSEHNTDLTAFPVWANLDTTTRNRIVSAAKAYLMKGDARTEEWIDKGEPFNPAIAGYRAMSLISQFEPSFLESENAQLWRRWAPTICFVWPYDTDNSGEENEQFLALANRSVPGDVQRLLLTHIGIENAKENPILRLHKFDSCWDEELRRVLRVALRDPGTVDSVFGQILRKLFELDDPSAPDIACEFVVLPTPTDEQQKGKCLTAIRQLINNGKATCWPKIWSAIRENDVDGKLLIESVIQGTYTSRKVRLDLSEPQSAEMFLWLSKIYPHAEDPLHRGSYSPSVRDDVVQWRDSFLYTLVEKGTNESVSQIERIREELPNLKGIDHLLVDAKEKLHEKSWKPLTPKAFHKSLHIDKANQKFYKLSLQYDAFSQSITNADDEARGFARNLAFERWIVLVISALLWIGLVYLLGWERMEWVTWGLTVVLGLALLGIACWFLEDSYFPLRPNAIFEKEKKLVYEKHKIDLNEGRAISDELIRSKRELEDLIQNGS